MTSDITDTAGTVPTIAEVAKLAGVSTATVSFVLNGRAEGRVAPATRDRVREAADTLGYVRHGRAVALSSGRSDLVVLQMDDRFALPRVMTKGFSQLADGLGAVGFTLAISSTGGARAGEIATKWAEQRPAAVLAPAPMITEDVLRLARRTGTVLIAVGTGPSELAPTIVLDDTPVGATAAEYLLTRGRTDLAVLAPSESSEYELAASRVSGALKRASGVRVRVEPMEPTPQAAANLVDRWLTSTLPDGVAGVTDVLAGLVHGALLDRGVAVPEQVSLVGIDDEPLCEMLRPRLTSVGLASSDDRPAFAALVLAAISGRWTEEPAVLSWPPVLRHRDT